METDFGVVVRADDAAGSVAANAAIAEALRAGVVRNVSVMGCGSDRCWDDWQERFFALPEAVRAEVDVGLHVTLNAEWQTPAVRFRPRVGTEAVPDLVESQTGFFTVSPNALLEQGWGHAQVDQAIWEVGAQLQRLRAAGIAPVYLDEHMGVGWLPGLRAALVDFAAAEGLIAVSTLVLPHLSLPPGLDFVEALVDAAARTPSPALLVLHPAQDGPETALFWNAEVPPGQVARERERERQAVCAPAVADRLRERNVRLLRYSDIAIR